ENMNQMLVPADALERLFLVLKEEIRLVVLSACYSEVQAKAISRVIDCVVGMRSPIGDDSACKLTPALYQALFRGKSVQNAFDQAVTALNLHNLGDEDVPRLVVREGVDPNEIFICVGQNEEKLGIADRLINIYVRDRRGKPLNGCRISFAMDGIPVGEVANS